MIVFTPVTFLLIAFGYANSVESIVKCCEPGLILNEAMKCEVSPNASNPLASTLNLSEEIIDINITCSINQKEEISNSSSEMQTFLNIPCADIGANGTLIFQNCSFIHRHDEQKSEQCRSLFTPINFWGVSIVVFASFIYILPYFIVVVLYCVMSDLRRKAFDKGVMCFCFTQVCIAAILCIFGYFMLCNTVIPGVGYALVGLILMFLTISSVFWMLVMCFDVTLTITRFRWAPSSNSDDESRKFRMYVCWIYGGTFIPTAFVGSLELVPLIPKDWSIKPNFQHFDNTNVAVIAYVTLIPFLVCVTNSILFVYTSWKMFKIQKSTSMVKENRKNKAKEKYITYLKLYFLMDAPWVTSTLGAIYPDLWILKLFRMVHPVLLLITILPRKMVVRSVKCARQTDFVKNTNPKKEVNITKDENLSRKKNNSPENVET